MTEFQYESEQTETISKRVVTRLVGSQTVDGCCVRVDGSSFAGWDDFDSETRVALATQLIDSLTDEERAATRVLRELAQARDALAASQSAVAAQVKSIDSVAEKSGLKRHWESTESFLQRICDEVKDHTKERDEAKAERDAAVRVRDNALDKLNRIASAVRAEL